MSPAHSTKRSARQIFTGALGLNDPSGREAYLDDACGSDMALRREVDILLATRLDQGASPLDVMEVAFGPAATLAGPAAESSPVEISTNPRVGPYKLLEPIGEGGFGVVYMAEQIRPVRRKVALKVIKPGMDSRSVIARFEAERQALAMMDHPHIARAFDAGTTEEGRPYFVMELVRGRPIVQSCDELKLGPRQRLELFVQVCRAVQHAHQKGVIHRDLKPSNILVTIHDDKPVPKIIDFGVAKAIGQQLSDQTVYTAFAQLIGTPLYMSPEQAALSGLDVDTRSDIYSLGVLLYELLTGTTPFERETLRRCGIDEMRRIIREEDPPRPSARISTLNAQSLATLSGQRGIDPRRFSRYLRGELDWIVMKALEKDRNRRYETASALAADVQRYLDDQPVQACPPSTWYSLLKLARRRRSLVVTAAVFLVLILISGRLLWNERSYTLAALSRERDQRRVAEQQEEKARQSEMVALARRDDALANQYRAEIVSGQNDLERGYLQRIGRKLAGHLPLPGQPDRRGWEWHYLWSLCHPEVRTLTASGHQYVAWSPDGEYIGSSGDIWRSQTGEAVRRFRPSNILRYRSAWSPDSRYFAWGMADDDNGVYLWDRADDKLRVLRGHASSVWSVGWSPDSKWLATGSIDRSVKVWDVPRGEVVHDFTTAEKVTDVAWSPDSELLAACITTSPPQMAIWNWTTKEQVGESGLEKGGNPQVLQLSWHPNGQQLAVSTEVDWLLIRRTDWTVTRQQELPNRRGRDIAWSPDGNRLGVADGTVLLIWDPLQAEPEITLNGHTHAILSVAWSPDGRQLVSSDEVGEVKIWDQASSSVPGSFSTHTAPGSLHWLPDGRTLAIVDQDSGALSLWDAASRQRTVGQQFRIESTATPGRVHWSPQCRLVACCDEESASAVRVLESRSGQVQAVRPGEPGDQVNALAWSKDERILAVAKRNGHEMAVILWDINRERDVLRWTYEGPKSPVFDPQGQSLVPVHWDNRVRLAWSPDGSQLAIAALGQKGDNGTSIWQGHVYVVNARTGQTVRKHNVGGWFHRADISALAWHPDGRAFLAGTKQGVIEAVNVATGDVVFSTRLQSARIESLAWSPDGQRIATAAEDRSVKVLSAAGGEDLMTLVLEDQPFQVTWSPNGHRLAAISFSGEVAVWDATRGYEFSEGVARRGELALAYYRQLGSLLPEERVDCLQKVLELAPDRLDFWSVRGHARAQQGDFDGAADEFAKLIGSGLRENFQPGQSYGYALLAAGRRDAFDAHIDALVNTFSDSPVESIRQQVAWLASLSPSTGTDTRFPPGVEALSYDSERGAELIAGAVLYRLGRFQEAADTLTRFTEKSTSSGDRNARPYLAQGLSLLAIARYRLGHTMPARRLLSESIELSETISFGNDWVTRLECQTLENEARSLILE